MSSDSGAELVDILRHRLAVEDDPATDRERRRAEISERIWRMRSTSVPVEVYFTDRLRAYNAETAAMVKRALTDEGLLPGPTDGGG